jgi:glycosyltransferase 2 family protein
MANRLPQQSLVERVLLADQVAPDRKFSWPVLLFKIGLAAAIVGWLCTGRLDLYKLAQVPLTLDLAFLFATIFGSMFVPAVRWWWLLRIQKLNVSLWQATKMTWLGYITSLVMPGAASGDVAKSYLIVNQQFGAKARSFSTVLVDRIIGIYALVLVGCLSAVWFKFAYPGMRSLESFSYVLFALLTGFTVAPLLVLLGPTRRILVCVLPLAWVDSWTESYQLYRQSKSVLAGCLILSLASSTMTAASFAAADRVIGGKVDWTASLQIGPLVMLANCVPLTPGGIGLAEASASELFNQVGSANGAEMMLAIRLVTAILALPGLMVVFGGRWILARTSSGPTTTATVDAPLKDAQHQVGRAA